MSTVFGNRRRISPRTLYSTFGPSTCVSGYGHARNDLLLLSHVYSMSQILPVVYSSYTPLYFPSFESRLSSSNLFSELSLSFVLALYLVLRNLGQEGDGRHNTYVEAKVLSLFKFCLSEFYFESILILFGFQLRKISVYNLPSCITA